MNSYWVTGYISPYPINSVDPNGEWVGQLIGALVFAYMGGSMSSGSFNPLDWEMKDWVSAGMGAFSGAQIGGQIEGSIISRKIMNNGMSTRYGLKKVHSLIHSNAYYSYLVSKGMQAYTLADAYIINRHDAVYGAEVV